MLKILRQYHYDIVLETVSFTNIVLFICRLLYSMLQINITYKPPGFNIVAEIVLTTDAAPLNTYSYKNEQDNTCFSHHKIELGQLLSSITHLKVLLMGLMRYSLYIAGVYIV